MTLNLDTGDSIQSQPVTAINRLWTVMRRVHLIQSMARADPYNGNDHLENVEKSATGNGTKRTYPIPRRTDEPKPDKHHRGIIYQ